MILNRSYISKNKDIFYSVAIGNFDGIHLGHRFILNELKSCKRTDKDKIAVITFNPHPIKILKPSLWKKNLIKFRTKFRLLENLGVDTLFQIPFTFDFSNINARFFIEDILIKNIQIKNILVGEDFRFGKNREGDIRLLKEYAEKNKFNLKYYKKKGTNENYYSSSIIRNLVKSGDLEQANSCLGYYWEVEAKVVKGRSKGRELGYPTANLNYSYQIAPANGIYAGLIKIENENIWRQAAISTGTRPHYKGKKKILEVHLLFFAGNLYQKRLRVAFIKKIRDEAKFQSEKAMVQQMDRDCKSVQIILKNRHIKNDNQGI
ncbi:MAG: riboflavin biosynthesis protein RibF [Pelagibacterales bacterium]|nr:riboflavin biosynthesis protein RibF [Pelagibacterales bacterium]|tara:strand:- start:5595 stop:6551 length:957 start_codon:yes stop_codon:yes gene_type:complete